MTDPVNEKDFVEKLNNVLTFLPKWLFGKNTRVDNTLNQFDPKSVKSKHETSTGPGNKDIQSAELKKRYMALANTINEDIIGPLKSIKNYHFNDDTIANIRQDVEAKLESGVLIDTSIAVAMFTINTLKKIRGKEVISRIKEQQSQLKKDVEALKADWDDEQYLKLKQDYTDKYKQLITNHKQAEEALDKRTPKIIVDAEIKRLPSYIKDALEGEAGKNGANSIVDMLLGANIKYLKKILDQDKLTASMGLEKQPFTELLKKHQLNEQSQPYLRYFYQRIGAANADEKINSVYNKYKAYIYNTLIDVLLGIGHHFDPKTNATIILDGATIAGIYPAKPDNADAAYLDLLNNKASEPAQYSKLYRSITKKVDENTFYGGKLSITKADATSWLLLKESEDKLIVELNSIRWSSINTDASKDKAIAKKFKITEQHKNLQSQNNTLKSLQVAHQVFKPGIHQTDNAIRLKTITDHQAFRLLHSNNSGQDAYFEIPAGAEERARQSLVKDKKSLAVASQANPIKLALSMGRQAFAEQWAKSKLKKNKLNLLEKATSPELLEGFVTYERMEHMALSSTVSLLKNTSSEVALDNRNANAQSSLTSLFNGGGDYCECPSYRNAWSPSAYIVDMLKWLINVRAENEEGINAFTELVQRRPDIIHVAFSKANTYTVIPYIDIELEALESLYLRIFNVKLNGNTPPHAELIDTAATKEELKAKPQVTHPEVFQAVYKHLAARDDVSMHSPYNLYLEKARLWVDNTLNRSLHDLLEIYSGPYTVTKSSGSQGALKVALDWGLSSPPANDEVLIKGFMGSPQWQAEYLGLTTAHIKKITEIPSAKQFIQFIDANNNLGGSLDDKKQAALALLNNESVGHQGLDTLYRKLVPQGAFTINDEDRFTFLTKALHSRFVIGANGGTAVNISPTGACSLEGLRLNITNLDTYIALYRFMLLLVNLPKWEPWHLDWAIADSNIDAPLMEQLALVKRLREETDCSIEQALFMWRGFYKGTSYSQSDKAATQPWQINQYFQSIVPSLSEPVRTAIVSGDNSWPQNLSDAEKSELYTTNTISALAVYMAIPEQQLATLVEQYHLSIDDQSNPKGVFEKLEKTYKIGHYLDVGLINTEELIAGADETAITAGQLKPILSHVLNYKLLSTYLDKPYAATLQLSTKGKDEKPSPELIELCNSSISQLMDWVLNSDLVREEHVNKYFTNQDPSNLFIKTIYQQIRRTLDTQDALAVYFSEPSHIQTSKLEFRANKDAWLALSAVNSEEIEIRNQKLLIKASEACQLKIETTTTFEKQGAIRSLNGLPQTLADGYAINANQVYIIDAPHTVSIKLSAINNSKAPVALKTLALGHSSGLDDSAALTDDLPFQQFIKKIHLILTFFNRFNITQEDIAVLNEAPGNTRVDFKKLFSNQFNFSDCQKALVTVSDYCNTWSDLSWPAQSKSQWLQSFPSLSVLKPSGVKWVLSEQVLNLLTNLGPTPDSGKTGTYSSEEWSEINALTWVSATPSESNIALFNTYPQLFLSYFSSWNKLSSNPTQVHALLPHTGYKPEEASFEGHKLFKKGPSNDWVNTLTNQTASERDHTQNLALYQTVNDKLRIQRRKALTSALLRESFSGLAELKETLLLPKECGVCKDTSRIREAMSVINRLGEEIKQNQNPNLKMSSQQKKQWLKYRSEKPLWQARVEIAANTFVYALPKFRRIKTELFKKQEDEMEQGNIDGDYADSLMLKYVEDLDQIGNLEFVTLLNTIPDSENQEASKPRRTYYFARTHSIPATYYFCHFDYIPTDDSKNGTFSPWKEIELDIEEPQLLPFMFKGRLYLFWPSIKITSDKSAITPYSGEGYNPEKFIVNLNYSYFSDGRWARQKKTLETVDVAIGLGNQLDNIEITKKKHLLQLASKRNTGSDNEYFSVQVGFWEAFQGPNIFPELLNTITQSIDDNFALYYKIEDSFPRRARLSINQTKEFLIDYSKDRINEIWEYSNAGNKYQALALLGVFGIFWPTQEGPQGSTIDSEGINITDDIVTKKFYIKKVKDTPDVIFSAINKAISNLVESVSNKPISDSGSESELVIKGRFIFDGCGECRQKSVVQEAYLENAVYNSSYHELEGLDMYNQKMIEDLSETNEPTNNDQFSVSSMSEHGIRSKEYIFNSTPTQYSFIPPAAQGSGKPTIPFSYPSIQSSDAIIPDDIEDALTQSNAVFQDTERSFSLLARSASEIYSNTTSLYIKYEESSVRKFNSVFTSEDNLKLEVHALPLMSHDDGTSLMGNIPSFSGGGGSRPGFGPGLPIFPDSDDGSPYLKALLTQLQKHKEDIDKWGDIVYSIKYDLIPLYHPYTCKYMRSINSKNSWESTARRLDRLFSIPNQYPELPPRSLFDSGTYNVYGENIDISRAEEDVNFQANHLYSEYNWELFYHLPFSLALKLAENQEFEAAYRYFHYIFNPDASEENAEPDKGVWRFKPFMENLSQMSLNHRLELSEDDPFNPHAIARRDVIVYKRAVVMKYIDTLIEEGDMEFLRYTGPSLERAEIKYNKALKLLGRRPQKLESNKDKQPKCFSQLLEEGSCYGYHGESYSDDSQVNVNPADTVELQANTDCFSALNQNYFCQPNNPKAQEYFDLLDQRMFNLMNCRDIDGEIRALPLYQPRIDPFLLIKADMSGLNLRDLLSQEISNSGLKFSSQVPLVSELINVASGLNSELHSAIQQKESKSLESLREKHQNAVLEGSRQFLRMQIDSSENTIKELEKTRSSSEFRLNYYASQSYEISAEKKQAEKIGTSKIWEYGAQTADVMAGVAFFSAMAGDKYGHAANTVGSGFRSVATYYRNESDLSGIKGGRLRRASEWKFQADSINKDLKGINQQIIGAQIRLNIAERELEDLENQIEQSDAMISVLRDQYTNTELYQFMEQDIRKLNKRAYQLAFDACQRLQNAYRFETGNLKDRFVKFVNWYSPKNELTAAKHLQQQINEMRVAFQKNSVPAKQRGKVFKYSMATHHKTKFAELIVKGKTTITLTGKMFDRSWPNHYFRRIKSISANFPGIMGPHSTVNGQMKLGGHYVNLDPDNSTYPTTQQLDSLSDSEKAKYWQPKGIYRDVMEFNEGLQDNGLLSFEQDGQRYNIMEGAGLDGIELLFELDQKLNDFDLSSLSDIELYIEFTARASGS